MHLPRCFFGLGAVVVGQITSEGTNAGRRKLQAGARAAEGATVWLELAGQA